MRSLLVATCVALCWTVVVHADFDKCLGLEMATLLTVPSCMELYSVCQVGVNKLNQKLHIAASDAYQPVTIISANESKTEMEENITMLAQVASLTNCLAASATGNEDRCDVNYEKLLSSHAANFITFYDVHVYCTSCKFNMSTVESYSIHLTHDIGASWNLEGYQRHSLSDNERVQIVEGYNNGQFYGSKLAVGIVDVPDPPAESDSKESASQTPIAVVAASVSALICLGLAVHQRRRYQNDYAPIHFTKG